MFSALALGVLVFSCQKENVEPVEMVDVVNNIVVADDSSEEFEQGSGNKASRLRELHKEYENGALIDIYCTPNGSDCLNTVVVIVSKVEPMNDVINTVNSGDPVAIVKAFNSKKVYLNSYIDSKYVNGVIDGSYTVINDESTNGNSRINYLQFTSSVNGVLEMTTPIKLTGNGK